MDFSILLLVSIQVIVLDSMRSPNELKANIKFFFLLMDKT